MRWRPTNGSNRPAKVIVANHDVGFGDAVTPAPQAVRYTVLLDGLPAPALRAYPKAT